MQARTGRRWRSAAAAALLSGLLGAGSVAHAADAPAPLRFCADPDNLPFSHDGGGPPGMYVEIGRLLGRTLGRPVEQAWSLTYFGKRTVRTQMLAGKCDATIGLPAVDDFMGRRVIVTKPFLDIGYALVTPAAGKPVARLDDLKGRLVAVQFSSSPQNLLAARDDIGTATVMDPDEAMRKLAAGQVAAAIVWGPTAGWINHTQLHDAYRVVPVDGPAMQWHAAIGLPAGSEALRDRLDAAIDADIDAIRAIAARYGLPQGPKLRLGAAASGAAGGGAIRLVADGEPAATPAAAAPASAADVAAGRAIFNGMCAHCHGPDAVQSERRINLRLLHERYGDDMDNVFETTVHHGRPSKGMPNWTGVYTEAQFRQILAFLHSVQAN